MRKVRLIVSLICFGALFSGCNTSTEGILMTVNGPVRPEIMGKTLSHEHLLVDFIGADRTGTHRWDKDSVAARMLPYLEELADYGVKTFIDATPAYLGRDPRLLKNLAEASGLHIVTNTGYYGARENQFVPHHAFEISAEELAEIWINEFRNGIDGSQVKPGFIKIGVDRNDTLSAIHRKLVTAAAITQKATGMVIASHTGPEAPAFEQMKILESQNIPLSRFIWVHAQRGSAESNIAAAQKGAWVSLDNVNATRDSKPDARFGSSWYAERLGQLKDAGCLHRVLISHDAGWYRPGEPDGGKVRGYTDLFTHLIPLLRENDFAEEDLKQLLVTNPMEAFSINLQKL